MENVNLNDLSNFDSDVRIAGPVASLFDFVAMDSFRVDRQMRFLRLRRQIVLENYSYFVIYQTVLGKLREPSDLSRLLRFAAVYFNVAFDNEDFLSLFNEHFCCSLTLSDFTLKTPSFF